MIKEIQELKERINRQNYHITNLENDEEKLKKEKLTLENNLEKSIQELQGFKK